MLKSIEKDGPERQRLSKTCLLDERHAGARRVQKNHAERGIRPGLPVPVFCQTALFFTLLARYFICEDQIIEIGPVRELRSYQIAKHSVSSFHMRARLPPFVYNNIPYGSEICKLYLCKITRKNCKRCRRAGKNRKVPFSASAAPPAPNRRGEPVCSPAQRSRFQPQRISRYVASAAAALIRLERRSRQLPPWEAFGNADIIRARK